MIYSRVDLYRPSSSHLQKQKLYIYIWSGQRLTSFCKQALVFTCLQYKSFKITVGKGEIVHNEQFLLFPQLFLPFWRPLCLFSSPKHKVLMVSFCDRPMSGVRLLSCIVHNFFKHFLLLNHRANLDETWQGCSFGEAQPKLSKRLNSNHNSGCHGNQKEKKKQNL